VDEGPFIELPGLGPSNLRDAVGAAVGIALDPLAVAGNPIGSYLSYAGTGAGFIDARSSHLRDLDALELTSIDYYATLRSVFQQARQAEIDEARGAAADPDHGHVPPE
jgi:phospholipid-binding lipoprotein MlaA